MRGTLPTRALAALTVVVGIVVGSCSGAPTQGAPAAGSSGSHSSALTMPLSRGDTVPAFRDAEAAFRRDGRDKAELAKVGPGALELAGLMDGTASFLLAQLPAKLKVLKALKAWTPPGEYVTPARAIASGLAGRLAAPILDLSPPGAPVFGTYLMTTVLFNELITHGNEGQEGECPCSKTATVPASTDEVSVGGNTGTITTTTTATVTANGSKLSLDLTVKMSGEVRDAVTGAVLYKIANEATGHADGDACPDATGTARAHLAFGGREDYFTATGARSGSGVSESLTGEVRIKVDDNAQIAGVDITSTGGGDLLIQLAATSAAPQFEKAWRSGLCIAVLVSPDGGEFDKDSVTTVTAKVKHKIEGNELDKPVEATLEGVKSIDPAGAKQKAPATFRYTAGPKDGDRGTVLFKSVSNRGIGQVSKTFTVAGGWTISSVGSSNEGFQGIVSNMLKVSIADLKVSAGKDNVLSGSGTITLTGPITASAGPLGVCRGDLDQTIPFTASGVLVGTGPGALLRLTLYTAAPPSGGTTLVTCPGTVSAPIPNSGYSDRYGETLGQFDLPADGGTTTISRTAAIGGIMNVAATGTFTVVRPKR